MSDHADTGRSRTDAPTPVPDETRVGAYDTDAGTVLYDAENPLAWIESSRTVTIDDAC